MTLNYSLNEFDYLQSQLFLASKTERVKSQRLRSWIIISTSFFLTGLIFYQNDVEFLAYFFFGFSVLSVFFFQTYQKFYYKKHFKKYISETFKNRLNQIATITFTDTQIECNDKSGEMKVNLTEIEEIFETGEYFYLKLLSGANLIIPKLKVENENQVEVELKLIANTLKVNYTVELDWKWN